MYGLQKMGVWWFDTKYTLGIIIAGLPPLEGMAFFSFVFHFPAFSPISV